MRRISRARKEPSFIALFQSTGRTNQFPLTKEQSRPWTLGLWAIIALVVTLIAICFTDIPSSPGVNHAAGPTVTRK